MEKNFILKGNVCYSKDKENVITKENAYIICVNGISKGVFEVIPEEYADLALIDYGDCLIVPGLIDLHIHAPQFAYRGLGMDMELLDWLNEHAFPEEAKYADEDYAKKAYGMFVEDMKKGATTRACIFASRHVGGTGILMELLDQAGLAAYVGKVNMDRNAPDYLREKDAQESLSDTREWIEDTQNRYVKVKPMLTPRFIPSCTDDLMKGLGELQKEYQLPVQSHLSENPSEIKWVQELCPWSDNYGDAYEHFGLFGGDTCPTIMAHCVYSDEAEIRRMKEQGVFIAHCPQSNENIASGIAPVRTYLDLDMNIGLGSDIAGGSSSSIFRAMVDAIQVSKLRWRLQDSDLKGLNMEEAFYMATKGGGAFFGNVGSFEEGYELDAVILDDKTLPHPQELILRDRLERMIYLSDDRHIVGKYVAGEDILS
ncbi:MAG: amidohydrolase family protein [Lachnospiraceae bacterium]|nr:amidohydrolase family protein [Lachnospiraceae bacterium]MDD3616164.1 amidohydrolase family protein [Lachnospiraceae bacterium]